MFDFQKQFHTGLVVPDLSRAMEEYGKALNLTWAKPFTFEALPIWTPETGLQHVRLEVTYSVEGPQHLEIQTGEAGSFYDPARGSNFHVGYWVEDLPAEIETMLSRGWKVLGAGAAPEDGYGTFAYVEQPGGGLRVELVSTVLLPTFENWWAGGEGLG